MTSKITNIRNSFDAIKKYRDNIIYILEKLQNRLIKLKSIHNEFSGEDNNNLSIFGLDSFNFQCKLLDIEYTNMRNIYNLITNRTFCDYYKLHNIICNFIKNNIKCNKIKNITKNSIEKYNYLDIYKHYDFDATANIFQDIIHYIVILIEYMETYDSKQKIYNDKKTCGLDIDNFIYTFEYKKKLLNEQIQLFIKYLEIFMKLHAKYFIRFIEKLNVQYNQLDKDIHFYEESLPKQEEKQNNNELLLDVSCNDIVNTDITYDSNVMIDYDDTKDISDNETYF